MRSGVFPASGGRCRPDARKRLSGCLGGVFWVKPGQLGRNLQKVSPPHPLFQRASAAPIGALSSVRWSPESIYTAQQFHSVGQRSDPPVHRHGFFPQRAAAALRAISRRRSPGSFAVPLGTFFFPPFLPISARYSLIAFDERLPAISKYYKPLKEFCKISPDYYKPLIA
jgi:hypothetical protein